MKDIWEQRKRRHLRDKCLLLNHRIIITDKQRSRAKVKASRLRVASRRTTTLSRAKP